LTAGQVWRRPDGLRWVEIQTAPVEPSGWRIMVPLVEPDQAPDAPPLVVTLERWRARVHLLTSAPRDQLGETEARLSIDELEALKTAAATLVRGT
jgi:hypothetical protein